MTDSVHSFQVVLAKDIREDDIDGIVGALKHVKGVLNVKPITSTYDSVMAETRAKAEMTDRLLKLAKEIREEWR